MSVKIISKVSNLNPVSIEQFVGARICTIETPEGGGRIFLDCLTKDNHMMCIALLEGKFALESSPEQARTRVGREVVKNGEDHICINDCDNCASPC